MKLLNIFSIVLSVIALIGSIFSYNRTTKTIAKLDDLDNAIFQWMKEELNSKVDKEGK